MYLHLSIENDKNDRNDGFSQNSKAEFVPG